MNERNQKKSFWLSIYFRHFNRTRLHLVISFFFSINSIFINIPDALLHFIFAVLMKVGKSILDKTGKNIQNQYLFMTATLFVWTLQARNHILIYFFFLFYIEVFIWQRFEHKYLDGNVEIFHRKRKIRQIEVGNHSKYESCCVLVKWFGNKLSIEHSFLFKYFHFEFSHQVFLWTLVNLGTGAN